MLGGRIAVLGDCGSLPWAPIIGGFMHGLARTFDSPSLRVHIEGPARNVPASMAHRALAIEELASFYPATALLFPHNDLRAEWKGYLDVLPASCRCVVMGYDDPYDMASSLALCQELAPRGLLTGVCTRAPMACDAYRREGYPATFLDACVDPRPFAATPVADKRIDVLSVQTRHFSPRRTLVPAIFDWCSRKGYRFTEFAGETRWIAGRPLATYMKASKVILECPRFDLAWQTNPHGVCDITGSPRLQLAAAAGTCALIVSDRPLHSYPAGALALCDIYPRASSAPKDWGEALAALIEDDELRQGIEAEATKRYERHDHPVFRIADLKAALFSFAPHASIVMTGVDCRGSAAVR